MKKIFLVFLFLLLKLNLNCEGRKVILLLGALHDSTASYMSHLKSELLEEDKNRVIIDGIDLDTFNLRIEEQADVVFNELKEKGITKEDKMVIIGHSQGGLRGYALYKKYCHELNIVALFTLASPWRGAQILESADDIKHRLIAYRSLIMKYTDYKYYKEYDDFLDLLKLLEISPGVCDMRISNDKWEQLKNVSQLYPNNPNVPSSIKRVSKRKNSDEKMNIGKLFEKLSTFDTRSFPIKIYCLIGGETDILKSSLITFENCIVEIKKIQKTLEDNKTTSKFLLPLIPITAIIDIFPTIFSVFTGAPFPITSTILNYNEIASYSDDIIKDLNKSMSKFIGSEIHDGVVSLEEQSFNNLIKEENMSINNIFIEDAFHGPISNAEKLFLEKAIYNHPGTINYINQKMKKFFSNHEIIELKEELND